jgi:hypothetical protein
MNRYTRGATIGGPSKASASTLCQKCLKRDTYTPLLCMTLEANCYLRHYSYECKAAAQERPYVSRPSRTQQLQNPKLAPKLMSDVPQDLLRKCVTSLHIVPSSSVEWSLFVGLSFVHQRSGFLLFFLLPMLNLQSERASRMSNLQKQSLREAGNVKDQVKTRSQEEHPSECDQPPQRPSQQYLRICRDHPP